MGSYSVKPSNTDQNSPSTHKLLLNSLKSNFYLKNNLEPVRTSKNILNSLNRQKTFKNSSKNSRNLPN
jgi:hypothetical protein